MSNTPQSTITGAAVTGSPEIVKPSSSTARRFGTFFAWLGFIVFGGDIAIGYTPAVIMVFALTFGILALRLWCVRRGEKLLFKYPQYGSRPFAFYFRTLWGSAWRSLAVFGVAALVMSFSGSTFEESGLRAGRLLDLWFCCSIVVLDVPFWTRNAAVKQRFGFARFVPSLVTAVIACLPVLLLVCVQTLSSHGFPAVTQAPPQMRFSSAPAQPVTHGDSNTAPGVIASATNATFETPPDARNTPPRKPKRDIDFEIGVEFFRQRNFTNAFTFLKDSAEQGKSEAQFYVANCYKHGLGVPQDYEQSVKWLRKAADQDLPEAEYNLAMSYYKGHGVDTNLTEAAKMLRKAADHGVIDAKYNLGIFYEYGYGVEHDDNEAAKWYQAAADGGDAGAQSKLGYFYSVGQGVPQSDTVSANWTRMAAEQGDVTAQNNLAKVYFQGRGVPKDTVEGLKWLILAANERSDAADALTAFKQDVPADVYEEAKRRADEFAPKKTSSNPPEQ